MWRPTESKALDGGETDLVLVLEPWGLCPGVSQAGPGSAVKPVLLTALNLDLEPDFPDSVHAHQLSCSFKPRLQLSSCGVIIMNL
jgi:hypothetical protein